MFNFNNMKFGSCENDNICYSPYGLAAPADGGWRAFDKSTGKIVDVTDFCDKSFNKMIFTMPVSVHQVEEGDIVVHDHKPIFVTSISHNPTRFVGIDVMKSAEVTVIPVSNPFGFDFVVKVVMPFGNMFEAPNAENPFGNMLPFMLMMNKDGNGNNNMMNMMMMMSMVGKNNAAAGNIDPMMLAMLMNNDSSDDNSPMMMYMMMNMMTPTYYSDTSVNREPSNEITITGEAAERFQQMLEELRNHPVEETQPDANAKN